ATALEADLRLPQPDAGTSGQHPDSVAVRPALDHREPERVRIETLRTLEVRYLQDQLRHARDCWRPVHGLSLCRPAGDHEKAPPASPAALRVSDIAVLNIAWRRQ